MDLEVVEISNYNKKEFKMIKIETMGNLFCKMFSCPFSCTSRGKHKTPVVKKRDVKYIHNFPCDCGNKHTDGPFFIVNASD